MTSFVAGKWAKRVIAKFFAPAKPTCKVCGRPLYAASSIIAGMGSVCAGRHARKDTRTIDMFEGGTVGSEHGSAA